MDQGQQGLSNKISVLEDRMNRLVGEDGNSGVIKKIENHLEELSRLKYIVIICLLLMTVFAGTSSPMYRAIVGFLFK